MTHAEAADALGWSRGTVGTYVQRGLERLRQAPGLREGMTGAVLTAALADVPALPPERLAALSECLWERAGSTVESAGGWWLAGRPRLVAAVTVCAGLATVGGLAAWPRPATEPQPLTAPSGEATVVEPLTLQAKNLQILHDVVLPQVVAKVQEWVPGNPVRVVSVKAYGSEVDVLLATDKPASHGWQGRSGLRLRYCTERRRLIAWDNTEGIDAVGGWRVLDPDRPYIVRVDLFGRRVEFWYGKEAFATIPLLFDALPRDEQARAEMLRHMFGPHEGDVEDVPLMAHAFGVAGSPAYQWLFTHRERQLFFRQRLGDEWRLWDDVEPTVIAASDTDLYFGRGAEIWSRPIADPTAPGMKVATSPTGHGVGAMTIAAGRLVVGFFNSNGVWVRSLAEAGPAWKQYFPGDRVWGVAGLGSRVYTMNNADRLVYFDLDAPDPRWVDAGPGRSRDDVRALAVWGDRVVYLHRDSRTWTRPHAEPQAGWTEISPEMKTK
jgi:hypothetical protein